ncbi:MAG: NAD(P)/FAD-dependent oxidoreductase [Candidatus Bathyarchaeia archaeon]
MDYDVIVAGAGPTGSTVARKIAHEGYRVLLAEEHREVGIPTHCTGKISINACKELELEPPHILNKVRGVVFHSPSGATFTIERKEVQAYIIDRAEFDKHLALKAVEAGATLSTNSRIREVVVTNSDVSVSLTLDGICEERTCRLLVAADGANSVIARKMGFYTKKWSDVRFGVQRQTSYTAKTPEFVEVFFGRNYAPGFFAWLVPISESSARVGLAVKPNAETSPRDYLEHLMRCHPSVSTKVKGASSESIVHPIPTGGCLSRTVGKGLLFVGDAAGQVKSTTGGGLYYGMLSANIAGKVICDSLERSSSVLKETDLEQYESGWRERLGREITFCQRTRAFIDSLSDEEFDYIFELLKCNEHFHMLVDAFADIDYQSRVAMRGLPLLIGEFVKKPQILYKLARFYAPLYGKY